MDMNVNRAREAKPVQITATSPTALTTPTEGPSDGKDTSILAEKITIQDKGPDFGKIGKVPGSIELPHDPLPPTPAEKVIDKALDGFRFNRVPLHPDEGGPVRPFEDRKLEFVEKLVNELNQPVGKSNKYKHSNIDLKTEIHRLRDEINRINRDLANGMTDCWGGLTNRKIECKMAIDAIEQALTERAEIKNYGKILKSKE